MFWLHVHLIPCFSSQAGEYSIVIFLLADAIRSSFLLYLICILTLCDLVNTQPSNRSRTLESLLCKFEWLTDVSQRVLLPMLKSRFFFYNVHLTYTVRKLTVTLWQHIFHTFYVCFHSSKHEAVHNSVAIFKNRLKTHPFCQHPTL